METYESQLRTRRSLLPFFVVMSTTAFCLNFLWEMLQMSAYAEMGGRPWRQTVLTNVLTTHNVNWTCAAGSEPVLTEGKLFGVCTGQLFSYCQQYVTLSFPRNS